MATHLKILSAQDIFDFDNPPEFTGEERKRFFALPDWARELVEKLQTPTNKIGFTLQFGYFKAVNKFFVARKFYTQDIEFVTRKLQCSSEEIDFEKYTDATFLRHQEIILENLGFQKFNENAEVLLKKEALSLCANQTKLRLIFMALGDFLRMKKFEIPSYNTFAEIITDAFRQFEKDLLSLLEQHLTTSEKELLDSLLEISDEYLIPEKQDLKLKRHKITLLKRSYQSTKTSLVQENIDDLEYLQTLFEQLKPIINHLGLSSENIQYYAKVLIKSQVFQISRRDDNKYLLLIAFVIHQYYTLNDVLVDIMIRTVQTTKNTILREHKENTYEARHTNYNIINNIAPTLKKSLSAWQEIKSTWDDEKLAEEAKIQAIKNLLPQLQIEDYARIQKQLVLLEKESARIINDDDSLDLWETKAVKLQNRVAAIIKHLVFNRTTSAGKIFAAMEYYQKTGGEIKAAAPVDFLDLVKQPQLVTEHGKFRSSLYKALLFKEIAEAIKSGALNLSYSYKYRAFEDYLIPQDIWNTQKTEMLARAGLTEFIDFQTVAANLNQILSPQYQATNENINTGKNKFVQINPDGNLIVSTPKTEDHEITDPISTLFPQNRFIPLFEVLTTVNKSTNFMDNFEHWQIKYNREKPPEKTFFAGIMGYGCNLGIRKIAKISNNINTNELETTVNWYFAEDNLIRANDTILKFMDQLQLPKVFQKNEDITHTSSDGQKFNIGVDSLNANYFYKYHGKDKGVSVYSFLDDKHRLPYSIVISSADRESAFVIDGLMHNEVVKSDIHSTDTHGYSEMIFGVTHLLGISYAPRIKNFKKQRLYSFDNPASYKDRGYKIFPDGKINSELIADNWDNILRLIATIKLKETTASQLFRRLSSYSQQHPLYRAIKEFGKIPKSIFLLKYIDDVELRQDIEKQLNKHENSNKFAKAVFHGNNQEFQQETKEEQLIAEGCKRLIQNAIICWNYLYLSQLLCNTKTEEEKSNLVQTIKNGSVIAWQHINLQGEYDFSEEILKNSLEFKLPELLELSIPIITLKKVA